MSEEEKYPQCIVYNRNYGQRTAKISKSGDVTFEKDGKLVNHYL